MWKDRIIKAYAWTTGILILFIVIGIVVGSFIFIINIVLSL